MQYLNASQQAELAVHGITTRDQALEAPGWLVGGEIRAALHGHAFSFVEHKPVGWDVHVGPPGHDNYQGSHTTSESGVLKWRVCTEKNALRGEQAIQAHGGALLHHPILLNPRNYVLDVRVTNGAGVDKHVMTIWQPHLDDGGVDTFGNTYVIDGQRVSVTSPDGTEVHFLIEGESIAAIQMDEPDRTISVSVAGKIQQVEVPATAIITLGALLAGQVEGPVRVTWDGQTRTLSQRALWKQNVTGDSVVVLS